MLPGPKVGLIIGKNGKTIKQLQEQSGAKMVVIQDGPNTEYVSCVMCYFNYDCVEISRCCIARQLSSSINVGSIVA